MGAGSAGSVLAARLTEDAHCKVLLLEAGGDELDNRAIDVPGFRHSLVQSPLDWDYINEPNGCCSTFIEKVSLGDTRCKFWGTGSKSGDTGSKCGDTGSKTADTGSKYGNTGGKSGDTGSKCGDTGSRFGDTGIKYPDTGSESGNTGSMSGGTGSKSADTGNRM